MGVERWPASGHSSKDGWYPANRMELERGEEEEGEDEEEEEADDKITNIFGRHGLLSPCAVRRATARLRRGRKKVAIATDAKSQCC